MIIKTIEILKRKFQLEHKFVKQNKTSFNIFEDILFLTSHMQN